MKKPFVAFILGVGIPGAGFAYAGRWKRGVMNFILFFVGIFLVPISLLLFTTLKPTYPQSVGLPIAAISGAFAYLSCRRSDGFVSSNDDFVSG
jgi:hypothetical protein